ncbi:MAG: exonuclease domain-containing protein [Actinobacteria bacterium]|nr:exonuclease domain-containing protein [Actinomycetota bacterium]
MAAPPQLVVLDTETTGLDPERERIFEIGAVRLGADLEVRERFVTLVDPGLPIPLFITRLVGIADADVRGAPAFAEAFSDLREFAGDALLVGHNVGFDRDHLAAGARRAGLPPLASTWFDTLEAALLLYPELDRHALAILAAGFGIERRAHRALPDAETAADVLKRLCARAAGLGAEERGLLTAIRWAPLELLDRFKAAPDNTPPPLVADVPRGAGGTLTMLPVDADGWRAELGVGANGEEEQTSAAAEPGLAARLPGFRRRPGQAQLAAAAAEVFAAGGVGLFEAGTGMGKSLAYLLPAAFASAAAGRRVVVSTKTKALQRQLAVHELPIVAKALPPGWRWALLMGRENYICRRRLDEAVATESETLPDRERALALAYLIGRTRRGEVDMSAMPYRASRELAALAELARELRSSRATCLGRHCPSRRGCHWRLAHSRAETAHLVCVNHALLLTGPETLPPFEDVVIDEAHLLYHEASEAFSEEIDALAIDVLLADLHGRRRQRALPLRLRAAAGRAEPGEARALVAAADSCERAAELLPDLVAVVGETLARLGVAARDDDAEPGGRDGGRRDAGGAEYKLSVWITPGLREHPAWDPFAVATGLLAEGLAALAAGVAPAAEALPEEHRDHAAVVALADDAANYAALLGELPESGGAEAVVWGEIEAAGRAGSAWGARASRSARWTLTRTPLTPARQVREALWDRLRSAVLTSATLTVAGSFAYFRDMTGLDADVDVVERIFPSPFDFSRQAVLVLEHDPGGAWQPDTLAQRQGERLKRLAAVTGGRTLALFTNKHDMHLVAAEVGPHVEDDGVLVLAQGLHGSATALADEFRTDPQTILMGVDTLWTGQDFPGDTLTCLVIAKLPFPRQDPLFHARRRACDETGERWFDKFYLPEAVLKFRQGFGRLIRTETDTGVVVVLDHRLTQKSYRRDFIDSLPKLAVIEAAPEDIPAVVEHYLRRLAGDA